MALYQLFSFPNYLFDSGSSIRFHFDKIRILLCYFQFSFELFFRSLSFLSSCQRAFYCQLSISHLISSKLQQIVSIYK